MDWQRRASSLETTLGPLMGGLRAVPRDGFLWRGDDQADSIALVDTGWLAGFREFADGRSQGTTLYLPGDCVGLSEIIGPARRLHDVRALTDARLRMLPAATVRESVIGSPNMAERVFAAVAAEQARQAERLLDVGRRSSRVRLAHFLAEVHTRLAQLTPLAAQSVPLPLNQATIGDLLAMSSVHVSRTFTELRVQALAYRSGGMVVIPDFERLARFAGFSPGYLGGAAYL